MICLHNKVAVSKMVKLCWKDLAKYVDKEITPGVTKDILELISFEPKELWARDRPNNIEIASLYLAMYKDLVGISYHQLRNAISDWHPLSSKSLSHNVKDPD